MIDTSSSSEDEINAAVAATVIGTLLIHKKNTKKKQKIWARKWLQRRNQGKTVLHMLNQELLTEDPTSYSNFLRLPNNLFKILLDLVEEDISKCDTFFRNSISAESRLQVTLRFLATGETYRSLMYSTRIHESTISRFIPEVCDAIYRHLKDTYLKVPNTEEEWEHIANMYYQLWDFPNCLGALDGRHIKFRAPRSTGSYYYNYKGDYSIILLGVADAEYKFTYVNVGINGRVSDGGVLRESSLWKVLNENTLNFPNPKSLPGRTMKVPYVIVADDAFPLCNRILKPYSQRGLTHDYRIYNYRLSRARRVIENSFGILANRFRVLLTPINLVPEKVEIITLCCVALHNFLLTENKVSYSDINTEGVTTNTLQRVCMSGGNRNCRDARDIRNEFQEFFNGSGARNWQEEQIAQFNM